MNLKSRSIWQFLLAVSLSMSSLGLVNAQSGGEFENGAFNSIPFAPINGSGKETRQAKPPIQLNSQESSDALRPQARIGSTQVPAQSTGFRPLPSSPSNPPQRDGSPMASYVDLIGTVLFIDDIMLPAQEAGVIKDLEVKEGDSIPAGKIVGRIDDELAQRILEQAKLRLAIAEDEANDTTAIRAAEKKYRVAGIEAEKISRLARSGSKSESDRLMADYTKEIAKLEWEKAVQASQKALGEKKLAEAQLMEAQTRLDRHVLRSDFDAFVIKIMKKPQEYVQPGEEVMRIARMDRLWVQGTVDIADLNPHEVLDRPVTVTVQLARNQTTTFEGKITNVGLERQGLSRYLVKAEVQNRPTGRHWMLQPLAEVQMRIHLDGVQAKSSLEAPQVKR